MIPKFTKTTITHIPTGIYIEVDGKPSKKEINAIYTRIWRKIRNAKGGK